MHTFGGLCQQLQSQLEPVGIGADLRVEALAGQTACVALGSLVVLGDMADPDPRRTPRPPWILRNCPNPRQLASTLARPAGEGRATARGEGLTSTPAL